MEHPLDVSQLEPPEPMERILGKLDELKAGDFLSVTHRREPFPLYPLIEQDGFRWRCIEESPALFRIYIWRVHDLRAEQLIP
ncbi:MAG: Clp protease ClpB [Gammaproteobacteria bacterium]|nr:MAG: Clp protease ClpB [Gammaproteobacteria bacterium]RLA24011.1 MAG: Clp protease ClpB [Gammaproteobacteria bacterium]